MLTITIGGEEYFDEDSGQFVMLDPVEVWLEHSLVSLSKWESKYQRPFLENDEKTPEEILDYLKGMVVDIDTDPDVLNRCTEQNLKDIQKYIESSESATTFGPSLEGVGASRGETITSELIYYWMVAFRIPFECQQWHLNRLLTLIKICSIKNSDEKKKIPRHEIARRNRELNAKRKAKLNTKG